MRKKDELSLEHTCMQHAHPEEMTFVLLSRDIAAPVAIRAWVMERCRLGKNHSADPQITEALECARVMEEEGRKWAPPLDHGIRGAAAHSAVERVLNDRSFNTEGIDTETRNDMLDAIVRAVLEATT